MGYLKLWELVLSAASYVVMMIQKHWQKMLIGVGIVFVLAFLILATKSCGKKTVKIDESQIQKINSENRQERIKELTEVVEANADVIKTVDERTELVNTAAEARNQEVDKRVAEADKKIQEAKANGKDVTASDLEELLLGGNQ